MHDRVPLQVHSLPRPLALLLLALLAWALPGCDTMDRVEKNPLGVLRDRSENSRARIMAAEYLREHRTDAAGLTVWPQATFKEIAWTMHEPAPLRATAIDALLNDSDPAVVEDARKMTRLMLPREPSREVVVVIARNAGEKEWKDFIPSLVRSYSRRYAGTEDSVRSERVAIEKLGDGRTVEQTAFDVFLNPPPTDQVEGLDWTLRCRTDAWDLLGRLDHDGSIRARLLAEADASKNDPLLDALRVCRRDLRAIPITGDELAWLSSLRRADRKENAAWWPQATAAIAALPPAQTNLRLRHAEPIRWASLAHPQWLAMTREELLSILKDRLAARAFHRRSLNDGPNSGPRPSERLEERLPEVTWGDALAILAIDEALHQPHIAGALFAQASADASDHTTEYGGLLALKADGQSVAMLYPPRPAQRQGDEKFIASDDMISSGDLSLAHYHFHVQETSNADYAGPSAGDLDYAARFGRSCIVLTSVREGVMDVDFYQSESLVVDLGELAQTPSPPPGR